MMSPLAVYVTRTGTGAFKEVHISNKPPEGAEVHLRTYDSEEARSIAARLRITLASSFDAAAYREGPRHFPPPGTRIGRPRTTNAPTIPQRQS